MNHTQKFIDRLARYGVDMTRYQVALENVEEGGSDGEIWFDHRDNDCQIRCYFHLAVGPNGEQAESYSMSLAMRS